MAMQTADVPVAATYVPGAASTDFPLRLRYVKQYTIAILKTIICVHYKLHSRIINTFRQKKRLKHNELQLTMAMQTAPMPVATTSIPGSASACFELRLRPVK